ncbi:MAG TPA: hypothetical protein VGO09_00710 [Flavisolibacter sp.]|jgi:hypothetical protein|nr:hypothetical protein [Flavisolibacter sp.]
MDTFVNIASFSILIAGIIAFMRFKKINEVYYPFIYFIWLGCLNEGISELLVKMHQYTYINNNIYVLLEAILLIRLFRLMGLFDQYPKMFYLLICLFIVAWMLESFIFGTITSVGKYFRIFYSSVIVILSINTINQLILRSGKSIQYNTDFILSMAFIIYFTFKILVHAFLIYGLYSSKSFVINIYIIMLCINLGVNLLYALAVLWMPKRLTYTLPL